MPTGTSGNIGFDETYIESIILSLEDLDSNVDFILNALNSLEKYISDNKMSGVESILEQDIENLRSYFDGEYRNIIENSRVSIETIYASMTDLDENTKGVIENGK